MDVNGHQKDDSFLIVDLVINQAADVVMSCQLAKHHDLCIDLNNKQ